MSRALLSQPTFESRASHMLSGGAPWIAAAAMLAITLFAPEVLRDGDSFWHLSAGDWIIAHGAVPHADTFSYSFAGAPWMSHEWLSEVLMAASFCATGWSGVVVLTALATALALFQLARHLGRWLPAGPTLLLLAGSCIASYLLARPYILALPALEAWVPGCSSLGAWHAVLALDTMPHWCRRHTGGVAVDRAAPC